MTAVFDPRFRGLLGEIVRRAPAVRGGRDREATARRRVAAGSGTFSGHRAYGVGEDLRLVDWNVYARSGELFLKVLEAEDRRTLTILVDRSPSMTTGTPLRLTGGLRLAAILGALALARLDGLHLVLGPREHHVLQGARSLELMLRLLAAANVATVPPLDLAMAPLDHGWLGAIAWISDFAVPQEYSSALRLLRRHGRTCTGYLPVVAEDEHPFADGWVEFVDPETGREERLEVDARLRAAMEQELRHLARRQASEFRAVGYPLVRMRLPAEHDFRLAAWWDGTWRSSI